ncbi:hypothetical protein WG219_09895 [Ectopseudomonas mendocina]|uniref:Uncharacterized protein n=1 Tax=Ectopseudomonas mendocina TaxID=300 RepID=A0ABZ2RN98_ECTME
MNHAISNAGALEAVYYTSIARDEDASRSFDLRSDQARDELEWRDIEDAMCCAPVAQRKEFWTQLMSLLDVEPRFMARQNVSLIAGPLQESVALAIDQKVRKEFGQ